MPEVSVHAKSTWLLDTALAARPPGALGADDAGVVTGVGVPVAGGLTVAVPVAVASPGRLAVAVAVGVLAWIIHEPPAGTW